MDAYNIFVSMQNSIFKDKGLIASLSVFSLALAAGVFLNRKPTPQDQKVKEQVTSSQLNQNQINEQLDNLNHLQALLADKAQEIQIKYHKSAPHLLSADCLQQILQFTSSVIDGNELELIYADNRKARRSCFKQLKKKLGKGESAELEMYYRFICTFEEQIQYLIEKAQKDFVVFLNIDYSVITDSIEFHMCDEGLAEWIRSWSIQIKEQLKEKLKLYEQPLPPDAILDIVNFQIQALGDQGDSFKIAVSDLHLESEEEHEPVPAFLQLFLEDLVFEKYGSQSQQITLSHEDLTPAISERLGILSQLKRSILAQIMQEQQVHSQSQESIGSGEMG